jgi:hypothetical protein
VSNASGRRPKSSKSFFHTEYAWKDYFIGELERWKTSVDMNYLEQRISYMPLASQISVEEKPVKLPDKKILIFNLILLHIIFYQINNYQLLLNILI